MRVALLAGAHSVHTQHIANALCRHGDEVTIFSLPNHFDVDGGYDSSVEVIYLDHGGTKGYFLNGKQLKKLLRAKSFDVLNAHYASGYGTLGNLTSFHPYILSVWGSDVYDFPVGNILKRLLLKANLEGADLLLSTSHCMARQTSRFVSNKRIIVTPFGVDTNEFFPQREAHSGINVGFVKSISPKYGLDFLLKAFRKALDASKHNGVLHLHIYGAGSQMNEMQQLTSELGLEDNVTFHGSIPHNEVPKKLASIDVFCVPSTLDSESFGVSAVEAMACAIPCITSDVEGLCEVMEDGVTGFIVPRKDSDALAVKLIQLIQSPDLRAKMGENGRRRVLEHYDWEKNFGIIQEAYRQMISLPTEPTT